MKKFFTITAAILLLAACGTEEASQKDKPDDDGSAKQEVSRNKQEVEEENKPKDDSTQQEDTSVVPEYKVNQNTFALESIGEANPQVALLTIDDAPDEHALEMAKTLKKLNAPAIFFVNGHFINSPEKEKVIKEIHDLGFIIGNHTYSHSDLTTLPEEKQKEEILSVNEIVEKIIGEKPKFFRAPFGKNTDYSRQLIDDEDMLLMNWTYGYDWEKEYMTGEAISDIMVNTPLLQDGANLLMHDREWTNDGLEKIVEGLRDKGYELLDPILIDTETK
ncbi:polysaccharide deacetylase family protein [Bacillus norwichensis]|uniref:Polysaccharide deacetylase family protein n=1 Tax=Bacillus norwichensis TaxID=2762217 RepID=A0ABR8VRP4_9BACI|nr:polysaccharide deacetylase family protein [Bacillus norwichensis]MBD8007387.1 polysaccharide deacetylase family protein [Bacillus norwichensis]